MCGQLHVPRLLKYKGEHKCLGEGGRQTDRELAGEPVHYNLTWTMS